MFKSALIVLTLSTGTAFAAADLETTANGPGSTVVGDVGQYTFTVANIGNKTADNVSLTIDLPATHTSPQVYIMGDLASYSGGCTLAGQRLTCPLGRLRRNQSAQVYVDIALPYSAASLDFIATAQTSSNENTTLNNTDAHSANITYIATAIPATVTVTNRHCTGTGLTAFFECTKFPSSITQHDAELQAGGTIAIPGYPTYGGSWSQPTADSLVFTYTESGTPVANFTGRGVGNDCFEGLTTFPNSGYVAPYEVCF
ncbi:MAG: hypothetical protein R3F60_20780 [bacterium]